MVVETTGEYLVFVACARLLLYFFFSSHLFNGISLTTLLRVRQFRFDIHICKLLNTPVAVFSELS